MGLTGAYTCRISSRGRNPEPPGSSRVAVGFVVGLALLVTACGKPAFCAESASAFISRIYGKYEGGNATGQKLDPPEIRALFVPHLASAMIKDQNAAALRREEGALSFDPFVDAQDWRIRDFRIATRPTKPRHVEATVTFQNIDRTTKVDLDLVELHRHWKISDITWMRGKTRATLRALYFPGKCNG